MMIKRLGGFLDEIWEVEGFGLVEERMNEDMKARTLNDGSEGRIISTEKFREKGINSMRTP